MTKDVSGSMNLDLQAIGGSDFYPPSNSNQTPLNFPIIVGEKYLEACKVTTKTNRTVFWLYCKLCDTKFTIASKEAHLKGRRHHAAYKTKVDPRHKVSQRPHRVEREKFRKAQAFFMMSK